MKCYPFMESAFFDALQRSGGADESQGWRALHWQEPRSDGDFFMPIYRRNQSWGEYVFDQGWEQGYRRAGLPYFPKLVTSVPFTPVPGPRWRGTLESPEALWRHVSESVAEQQASGWHLLFPDNSTREALAELPLVSRQACHFRWNNRDYTDFEGFLALLTSRKRKAIRKERLAVAAHGLDIRRASGADIPADWWPAFYHCYAMTYFKRGQKPYLRPEFFAHLVNSVLREQLTIVAAFSADQMIGAAFYLSDSETLYGRYWGCTAEYDALHFELCYYQGIELCIEKKLQRFDPGVQGEHKIFRGFEPEITWSLHWLADPRFHQAIGQFCQDEARSVQAYQQDARSILPYREGVLEKS
ncbi:MAG: GNAT family N-acetyltransferase [Gammaproteobacteria bacterium]|nr:GNAT family N-acetyltransferase [Gammaproteobacteria bacterium]MBQ0774608.1 GNAT family N-acetyltransferase [Gammaproteobacteria bacterium]